MNKQFIRTMAITSAGTLLLMLTINSLSIAQRRKKTEQQPIAAKDSTVRPPMLIKSGPKTAPKKFGEVITSSAIADSGLFNIYKQDDKVFFEIADSLLGRDVLVV